MALALSTVKVLLETYWYLDVIIDLNSDANKAADILFDPVFALATAIPELFSPNVTNTSPSLPELAKLLL